MDAWRHRFMKTHLSKSRSLRSIYRIEAAMTIAFDGLHALGGGEMNKQNDTEALGTYVHRSVLWTLTSSKERVNPWGEVTLFARMTGPDGSVLRIPAFWDGGTTWRFRLTAVVPSQWQLETECSDAGDTGLHGKTASLSVQPAAAGEQNPFYAHGAVRVAGRHFEHLDGTPFHWLADTWWMLMTERVS